MKFSKLLICLLFLVLSQKCMAKTPLHNSAIIQKIEHTLNLYIQGSSYNYPGQLNQAFNQGAELFLDDSNGDLRVMRAEDYVKLFAKHPAGKVNNRIGEVLSIDKYENTATAKVEILMPNTQRRFIDYFILKLVEGKWKIVSKAASSQASNRHGRRVLFILSNAHFHGDSTIKAGNSFGEIVDAYDEFSKAGFTIHFVTPEGGAAPLTYINTSDKSQKHYLYQPDFMYALANTKTPSDIVPRDYKAVYYVGGSSAIYDIPQNSAIQSLSMSIFQQQGVISAVCHGVAGLVNLETNDGVYLLAGKQVTGYPDAYEKQESAYFKQFPFLIEETIKSRHGNFSSAPRNTEYVVTDGRIVTGQNYLSARTVAKKTIALLN